MPKEDFVEKNPYIVYAGEPESEGGSGGGDDAGIFKAKFVYADGDVTGNCTLNDVLDAINGGKTTISTVFTSNIDRPAAMNVIMDNNDPAADAINVYFWWWNNGPYSGGPIAWDDGEQKWYIED